MELAVVLVIVALLLGGLMVPLSSQRDQQSREATIKLLNDSREALQGYAAVSGRVPCPAVNAGEEESPAGGGHCAQASGYLPGPTLGMLTMDGWNRPLRYAVATSYLDTSLPYPTGSNPVFDKSTTKNGLLYFPIAHENLQTDLRACTTGTVYSRVIFGAPASPPCPVPQSSSGELFAAVWSDGPSDSISTDDLAAWPSYLVLMQRVTIGQ